MSSSSSSTVKVPVPSTERPSSATKLRSKCSASRFNAAHDLTSPTIPRQQNSPLGVSLDFIRHFLTTLPPSLLTWQLKEQLVVPATLPHRCTYVDLLLTQNPAWVGTSTCFVSHAYSYEVRDTFEVMLRYAERHPGVYFWYDPFSLNQHIDGEGGVVNTDVLMNAFGDNVRARGSTLIVSSPWDNPAFLSRAWCLFELMTSVNVGVPIEIVLPHAQEQAFIQDLSQSWSVVYEALAKIDSRRATAREAADLAAITRVVDSTVTHSGLNKIANTAMRGWLVDTALREEDRLRLLVEAGHHDKEKDLVDFMLTSSVMMKELGEVRHGERISRQCLELSERLHGPIHPSTLQSLSNLATLLQDQGKLTEAEPLCLRALSGQEASLGPTHPDTLGSLNNLAVLLQGRGKLAEAEVLCRRALAAKEESLGPTHPSTLTSANNLASLLQDQGKLTEAEPLYRRALREKEESLGATHPSTLTTVNNLARLLKAQGKLTEAEPLYRQALIGQEERLGPIHPETLTSVNNLAVLLQDQGKLAEAEPLFRRALAGCEESLGPSHLYTLGCVNNLASLLYAQGELVEAESLYERVLAGSLESLGATHPATLNAEHVLSVLVKDRGKLTSIDAHPHRDTTHTNTHKQTHT